MQRTAVVVCLLSIALLIPPSSSAAEAATLAEGRASGQFSVSGKATALAYAVVFVDESDDRKPLILVVSDKELPAAEWKSGSDFMMWRLKNKIVGVGFWLDGERTVFRTDFYDGTDFPTSASGLFELTLEDPSSSRSLKGTARTTEAAGSLTEPLALETAFHAARK